MSNNLSKDELKDWKEWDDYITSKFVSEPETTKPIRDLSTQDNREFWERANRLQIRADLWSHIIEKIAPERRHIDNNNEMREKSGAIKSDDKIIAFLYTLMRDHLAVGIVEKLVRDNQEQDTFAFTNGWLAQIAMDMAARLK